MTPFQAAVVAARTATEQMPDQDQAPVLQFVGEHAILTCLVPNVEVVLHLAHSAATTLAVELIVVADSYYATVDFDGDDDQAREAAEAMRRGDLAARFSTGDPTVVEALNVLCLRRDGSGSMATLPYRRQAGDRSDVEWLTPIFHHVDEDTELAGRIPESLNEALDDIEYVAALPATEVAAFTAMGQALIDADLAIAGVTERSEVRER